MSVPWYLMAKGKGGVGYKTASGPIVSVNDALAAPLRSLVANIDPVQDLHGYDNPWPAGGGKNLLSLPDETFVQFEEYEIDPIPAGTYIYSGIVTSTDTDNNNCAIIFLDESKNVLASKALGRSTGTTRVASSEFTVSSAIKYIRLYASNGYPSGEGDTANFKDNMICLSSATNPTAFAPYSNICPISGWTEAKVWVKPTYDPTANPTATLQLGQTVYGGTLDVTHGVLTVDREAVTLPIGNPALIGTYSDRKDYGWNFPQKASGLLNIWSQAFKTESVNGVPPIYCVAGRAVNKYVTFGVPLAEADDAQSAGDYIRSLSPKIVIELATPITIPLTPTEVTTLLGQNNIWADSGDVTVEYLSAGGANPDLMKLAVAFMGRE